MRFFIICALLILGGGVEGQKKKPKPPAAASAGKITCKQGQPVFSGPIKGWMEKDCKAADAGQPDMSKLKSLEEIEAVIYKPIADSMKCLHRKMGAMGKNGVPIRPKSVSSFTSLYKGDQAKTQATKTGINKCWDQKGQSLKSDKEWGPFSVCILTILQGNCMTKEQLEAMQNQLAQLG